MKRLTRAIIHVDGDAFFASCEQAIDIRLKDKVVVTGEERGIASALCYKAKALGISRGMPMWEVKKLCPQVVIVKSHYDIYKIFSRRMCDIVKRYSDAVEEYSIDECFADITGQEERLGMSYEQIAERIKYDLERELNMTFSIGLGPNKLIAKVASKTRKPSGLTFIYPDKIDEFLGDLKVGNLWGIGGRMTIRMMRYGVHTALDLKYKSRDWVKEHLEKPYQIMWEELQGACVGQIHKHRDPHKSIHRTRMFRPPSGSKARLLSELSKNTQEALCRARREGLRAKEFYFYIKTQEFTYAGSDFTLDSNLETPEEFLRIIEKELNRLFVPGTIYRATGVILKALKPREIAQEDLFGESKKRSGREELYALIDALAKRYKKPIIWLASSLLAGKRGIIKRPDSILEHQKSVRKKEISVENLSLPFIGFVT